jgi:hypothetical protein
MPTYAMVMTMKTVALLMCLLCVSCSRIILDRVQPDRDRVAALPLNASFGSRDVHGARICFAPLDLATVDPGPEALEIQNRIMREFDRHWQREFTSSARGRLVLCSKPEEATYLVSIRIEKIRTQNPITFLNRFRSPGKMITYSARALDQRTGELCFGMKKEWRFYGSLEIAFLAETICRKLLETRPSGA